MIVDKGFFQLARNASKNSNHRVKIGCVIALHGKPVSIGWNVVKTHPIYTAGSFRQSIHAEIKAVITARCDLEGGIAYVYREYKNGMPAICKPCALCYDILSEAGIKTVYYTVKEYPHFRKEKIR